MKSPTTKHKKITYWTVSTAILLSVFLFGNLLTAYATNENISLNEAVSENWQEDTSTPQELDNPVLASSKPEERTMANAEMEDAAIELEPTQEDAAQTLALPTLDETPSLTGKAGDVTFADQFQDPVFAQSIAALRGKQPGDIITSEDIQNLRYVSFQKDADKEITDITGIGIFTNIESITLSGTKLNALPEDFGNLKNLVVAQLFGNQIASLPESIGSLPKLRTLNLDSNQLRNIPDSICNLPSLKYLYLERNQLEALPESLGNLSNLYQLTAHNNNLTMLPSSIGQLNNLHNLYLSNNQITHFPDEISNLTTLEILSASNNAITHFPREMSSMANLQILELSNNNITQVPTAVALLPHLRTLWLDNNQITEMPAPLANLANFEILNLENNHITNLPAELYNHEYVWDGVFEHQRFTQTLPTKGKTKQAYKFAALPIYEQISSYQLPNNIHFTYSLQMPNGTSAVLKNSQFDIKNGTVTITDTTLLQQTGNYHFTANNTQKDWKYTQNFTLELDSPSSEVPPASSEVPPASSIAPPASSTAPPASSMTPPASSMAPPASSTTPPASSMAPPASSTTPPASSTAPPASNTEPPTSSENTGAAEQTHSMANEETLHQLAESGVPIFNIGDNQVPLFGSNSANVWALFNLFMAISSIGFAGGLFIQLLFKKQKYTNAKKRINTILRILGTILGLANFVLFFVVSSLQGVLVLFDKWSLLMGVLFASQTLMALLIKKSKTNKETQAI